MRSLQELGLAGEDDDEWMAALASPVDRFLEETRLSVRAYSALDRVADDLGARTLRQLCTRQADALLRRRAGRRGWREVVDALADWLEQRTDDPDPDAELEEPAQASLFGPPRPRVVPAPLPPPGDAGSLVSWAEGMKIADLLNQPISQALPSNVLALLPAPPDSRLLDVLSASPRKSPSGPGRPPLRRAVAISGILRDFVGHHLNAVSENRRVQAEREAAHPRVPGTADLEPLTRFRDALVAARAALGAGQPRPPGTYLPEISYAEEPARLDYRESAGAQAGVPFVSHGPGSVQIHLAGWSARPLAAVCACRIGPDACEHRRAAFDAALDLLERPTLAAHQKLRAYLATPPWQRLLAQVERGARRRRSRRAPGGRAPGLGRQTARRGHRHPGPHHPAPRRSRVVQGRDRLHRGPGPGDAVLCRRRGRAGD